MWSLNDRCGGGGARIDRHGGFELEWFVMVGLELEMFLMVGV